MKTRTIYNAYQRVFRNQDWTDNPRWMRQSAKFRAELSRRMEERDELVAEKNDRIKRLQALHAVNPGVKPWSSDRATT